MSVNSSIHWLRWLVLLLHYYSREENESNALGSVSHCQSSWLSLVCNIRIHLRCILMEVINWTPYSHSVASLSGITLLSNLIGVSVHTCAVEPSLDDYQVMSEGHTTGLPDIQNVLIHSEQSLHLKAFASLS